MSWPTGCRDIVLREVLPMLEERVRELALLRALEQPEATGEAVPVPIARFVREIVAQGTEEDVEYLMLAWAHEDAVFRARHWSAAAWAAVAALDPDDDIDDYVHRARAACAAEPRPSR